MTFKKRDLVFLGSIVVVSLLLFLGKSFLKGKQGDIVEVYVQGELDGTYDLEKDQSIEIKGYGNGRNLLVIKNHEAYMKEADCKDKICVHHKPISRNGESITCLPNKIIVTVVSNKKDAFDALTR